MDDLHARIKTPPRVSTFLTRLLDNRAFTTFLARFGVRLSRAKGGPFRFGSTIIAARHKDVSELLHRDLDFLIAPINAARIEAVNGGPFILGMDRSAALIREREALYAALAQMDLAALETRIRTEARQRLETGCPRFDAIADYARPVATATAKAVFGIAPEDEALFADAVRAIFAHTFLNLGNDSAVEARALAAAPLMHDWFSAEIARRRNTDTLGDDLMGHLLRQGRLDDDSVRRTLGGMLVGSIDTTASTFARIFCVVAEDKALAAHLISDWRQGRDIYGLCLDALRRWPHNPILLRKAAAETTLGGTKVRAGDRVIGWTEAAMLDPDAFPDPERMLPDRPMAPYLHFGTGLHPCAGRSINALQIPILIGILLDAGAKPNGALHWAGPFPDSLPVRISENRQDREA